MFVLNDVVEIECNEIKQLEEAQSKVFEAIGLIKKATYSYQLSDAIVSKTITRLKDISGCFLSEEGNSYTIETLINEITLREYERQISLEEVI